ncbi:MAG TPA: type IIL restriction-modification enzyme MmeI, partial [Thermoanaerobaculia bacterium]|nr:type IIL restriction-modification enzyme MmeI [Thermoanaerobaculia bacterium]
FVGNPPFMGGQKLTGALGRPYREYLVDHLAGGARGSADLVSYFFLRAFRLLREGGTFGLLATNTIAEGDTRQVGLEQILRGGGAIFSAHPNEPWPNDAAVVTSRVHVHKGRWQGRHSLLGGEAPQISAFLTDREEWTPQRLKANAGIAFQGSIILGLGFTLSESQALEWIARDGRYRDVLFPYLNGEDLNTHPEQKPSRWVICFWDWPEERARSYPLAFEQVERLVKPQRLENNRKVYRDYWWHFAEKRPALYHAIGRGHHFEHHPEGWNPNEQPLEHVQAYSLVSKHWAPVLISNRIVFSHMLGVTADSDIFAFAVGVSCWHREWAFGQASRMKRDLRYTPSDCFETFPLPAFVTTARQELGTEATAYHVLRSEIMHGGEIGLTKLYNRLHDPSDHEPRLVRLRELQVEIDRSVADAYGWSDLDLEHGFHEVGYLPENDRVRFTVSEAARRELLDRLARLNRERHAEEVAAGLHEPATRRSTATRRRSTPEPRATNPEPQPAPEPGLPQNVALFAEGYDQPREPLPRAADTPTPSPYVPARETLLADLRTHPGWHSRADILTRTTLDPTHWLPAITALVNSGAVERTGQKRGTRYRLKEPTHG